MSDLTPDKLQSDESTRHAFVDWVTDVDVKDLDAMALCGMIFDVASLGWIVNPHQVDCEHCLNHKHWGLWELSHTTL